MSIAEKLREAAAMTVSCRRVDHFALALTGKPANCPKGCEDCIKKWYEKLADAIEAEQTVDVAALLKLADDLDETNRRTGRVCLQPIEAADRIREILKGAAESKPTPLPEGIEWPRFEDGELVKIGDKFAHDGITDTVEQFTFRKAGFWVYGNGYPAWEFYSWGETVKRPEPEVLDADGVPIRVGDTVWYEGEEFVVADVFNDGVNLNSSKKDECGFSLHSVANAEPEFCTHLKPDTAESLLREFIDAANSDDGPDLTPIIERSLKLLGGE